MTTQQHDAQHHADHADHVDFANPALAVTVGDACVNHASHGYIHDKDAYLRRMRRIEGQTRGLAKMIEEEQYCIDILTQVSAVTKALQSVALGLLNEHLSHCVVNAVREGGAEAELKLTEAQQAIARLMRS